MKLSFVCLAALAFAGFACAQEPINTAVSQPTANQGVVQQPSVSQPMAISPASVTSPSLTQRVATQPAPPALSEPLYANITQPTLQPSVAKACGCAERNK